MVCLCNVITYNYVMLTEVRILISMQSMQLPRSRMRNDNVENKRAGFSLWYIDGPRWQLMAQGIQTARCTDYIHTHMYKLTVAFQPATYIACHN